MPRLLIIAAFFPPSRKIGARRPDRFARRLAERGWEVTVLTLRHEDGEAAEADEMPVGVRVIRTRAFIPGNALRRAATTWSELRRGEGSSPAATQAERSSPPAPRSPMGGLRSAFWRRVTSLEFPDRWIGWSPFARAAVRGERFDAVLGTLPPYSAALIARSVARRSGAILALDYRDPWTEAPRQGWDPALFEHLLERHRRVEDECLRASDVVLGTSPTICRWLAPRAGLEPVFAPNSFDLRSARPTPSRALLYAGSLAYGRSLAPVLAAMGRLADDPAGRDLELHYAGSDAARLRADAAGFRLGERVRDLGFLTAGETVERSRTALAAVVLVTPGYEYMLPGKLFEVVAAGAPMLLVAPDDSDVTRLCRRYGLGWQHPPEDIAGIANSLRRALAGDVPEPRDVHELSTDHVVAEVDRALRAALARGPRRGS